MTKTNTPFAVLLAAAMFAALWVPTLTMEAKAAPMHGAPAAELA